MSRWLVVPLVCGLLLAAVIGVRDFDPSGAPTDEILAYEVGPEQGVEVMLHGGVEQVTLTSWVLAPFDATPEDELAYALEVQLSDSRGRRLLTRRYEALSRPVEHGPAGFETRLSDGQTSVGQPRTLAVDVRSLVGSAGRLRVTSAPGKYPRVLLRLAHQVRRSRFEKEIMARTLGAQDRENLTRERTSLGFFDIPDSIRTGALSHWQRRLTAAGREGRDYFVRRLLIGRNTRQSSPPAPDGRTVRLSPDRGAAFNITEPVSFRLHSETDTTLTVSRLPGGEVSEHALSAGGALDLELGQRGEEEELSSVLLFANPPANLRLTSSLEQGQSVLRGEPLRVLGGRLEVLPDYRFQSCYPLSPDKPLQFTVAPGQRELGIGVRSTGAPLATEGSVHVALLNEEGGELSRFEVPLRWQASRFETLADDAVSNPDFAYLHLPAEVAHVRLTGSSELVLSAFADEPHFEGISYDPPYDLPVPAGHRLRHAPLATRDWASLRPDPPGAQERELRARAQVRLERREREGRDIEPRVLRPQGMPANRPLFVPTDNPPDAPFPANGWLLLDHANSSRVVRALGPGPTTVWFYADTARLGGTWRLRSQEGVLLEESIELASGQRGVSLGPTATDIQVEGLGKAGRLLMRAQPVGGGEVVERKTVYALDSGDSVDFPFRREAGEVLSLFVGVATRGKALPRLRHRVDRGQRSSRRSHFYKRPTHWQGLHSLAAAPQSRRALLWDRPSDGEAQEGLTERYFLLRIQLGDDLPVGSHHLSLHNATPKGAQPPNQTWVRAVVVGSVLPTR